MPFLCQTKRRAPGIWLYLVWFVISSFILGEMLKVTCHRIKDLQTDGVSLPGLHNGSGDVVEYCEEDQEVVWVGNGTF